MIATRRGKRATPAAHGVLKGALVDVGDPGDRGDAVGRVGCVTRLGQLLAGELGHRAEAPVFADPLKPQRLSARLEVVGARRGDVEHELTARRQPLRGGAEGGDLVGAAQEMLEGPQRADHEVERAERCGRGAHVGLDDADAGVAHRRGAVLEHHRRCVERSHVVAVLRERDRDAPEARAEFEDASAAEAAGQLSVEIEISVDRAEIEFVEGRDRFE